MQLSRLLHFHVARGSLNRRDSRIGVGIGTGAIALCMTLACAMTAQAAQNTTPHRMRNVHRTEVAALDADPLDATDARFLLTRTGFAANASELTPYIGKTREEAVDALLAGARTEAATPPPAWVTEPIPSADVRRAWTQDQRRDDQREQSRRYNELRGWWVREMVTTRSPLTERLRVSHYDIRTALRGLFLSEAF
jgi:uncharacterized protein (DUF1800 family)